MTTKVSRVQDLGARLDKLEYDDLIECWRATHLKRLWGAADYEWFRHVSVYIFDRIQEEKI